MGIAQDMNIATPSMAAGKGPFVLGCILILAFAVYANTLVNGFVYDDHHQLEENPYAHSSQYVGKIFTSTVWAFQSEEGKTNYYRPLMTFGYLLGNKAFQSLPYGFHLVNILLNCVVVGLVFLLCARLSGDETVALAAAAFFALHPIHTEVVAWIAAVPELELAIFYLTSFILFLRLSSVESPHKQRTQGLMLVSFVLALLSKEQAMTLLVLATIYEHFYRPDCATTNWRTKASRYGGFWLVGAAYMIFRTAVLGGVAPVLQHPDVTWWQAFLSALALAGQYVDKLIWPHPILAFYVFHKSSALPDPRVLVGIGVCGLVVALFVFLWQRARIYSFALIWMFVTLAPVLNARWMATNVFTERYLYLPSVGFCVLLAGGMVWLFRRLDERSPIFRWALAGSTVIVVSIAGSQIVARNRDWRDDFTLFSRTLAVEPHASYIRSDLGVLEWDQHREQEAERQWRLALLDKPDNVVALSNLGLAMLEKKRYLEAESFLRRAIKFRPHFAAPHVHLGRVYLAEGNIAAAEAEFRRAVEIYPLSTQARNALGKFYFDEGKLSEAEEHYRASAESFANAEAWNHLGDIYFRQGLAAKAEQAWRTVLDLAPYDSHAHLSLGDAYSAGGRQAEAQKEYRAVLLMDPKNEEALAGLRRMNPREIPAVQR